MDFGGPILQSESKDETLPNLGAEGGRQFGQCLKGFQFLTLWWEYAKKVKVEFPINMGTLKIIFLNIAKGTTDPGVDCFGLVGLVW